MKENKKYVVLRDTSEKENHGWVFEEDDRCRETREYNLFTGDYTLLGYEDAFIIERKASTAEIAKNINEKRFKEELERMEQFKYPFLVLEFDICDIFSFPSNSGIPKYVWPRLKVTNKYILSILTEYQFKYKTKIIYAGFNGKEIAKQLFRWVVEYVK